MPQVRALLAGADFLADDERRAGIYAIRLAVWGKPEDLQKALSKPAPAGGRPTETKLLPGATGALVDPDRDDRLLGIIVVD